MVDGEQPRKPRKAPFSTMRTTFFNSSSRTISHAPAPSFTAPGVAGRPTPTRTSWWSGREKACRSSRLDEELPDYRFVESLGSQTFESGAIFTGVQEGSDSRLRLKRNGERRLRLECEKYPFCRLSKYSTTSFITTPLTRAPTRFKIARVSFKSRSRQTPERTTTRTSSTSDESFPVVAESRTGSESRIRN